MSVSGVDGAALDAGVAAQDGAPGDLTPDQQFAAARVAHGLGVLEAAQRALDGQRAKRDRIAADLTGVDLAIAECEAALEAARSEVAAGRQAVADADAAAPDARLTAAGRVADDAAAELADAEARLEAARARLEALGG